MTLDCMPWGRPLPGSETKWSKAMERLYRGREAGPIRFWRAQIRLEKISVDPGDFLGAPRVGRDRAADEFVLSHKSIDVDDQQWLALNNGRYIFELVTDRWPDLNRFLVRPASDHLSPTWLHGRALEECPRVVDEALTLRAWTDAMPPEHAEEYGNSLVAAASQARDGRLQPLRSSKTKPVPNVGPSAGVATKVDVFIGTASATPQPSPDEVMARLAAIPPSPEENGGSRQSIGEQVEIVEAIGHWYIFWGRHGHPILASY